MRLRLQYLIGCVVLAFGHVQAATLATNQTPGFRLTVELRDGSRIVGSSQGDTFEFHSSVLGKIELQLEKIRSLESLPRTNLAKLTTTNGDLLTVELAMADIRVETTYGKIKLPVELIKNLRIATRSQGGRPKDGLIGLWSAEGNAFDSIRENNGTLRNVTFTDGVSGQAFSFAPESYPYGTFTGVQVPDRSAYILTEAFTIEGWVRPRGDGYIILCRGDHRPGLDPYTLSMQANHTLRFQICAAENETAYVDATLPYGQWTHVAAVFDANFKNMISLYTNGVLAAQKETNVRPMGELQPQMSPGLGIGNLNDGGNNFPFNGDIDELALYNRALSVEEIIAVWAEHSAHADGRAGPFPSRDPFHTRSSQLPGYISD